MMYCFQGFDSVVGREVGCQVKIEGRGARMVNCLERGANDLHMVPLPSSRHHLSYDDCLEDKRENYQNCSVLCSVRQLYTMIRTHVSSS